MRAICERFFEEKTKKKIRAKGENTYKPSSLTRRAAVMLMSHLT